MIEFWEYNGNILQPKSNRSLRLTRLLVTIAAEYQVNPEYSSLKPTSFITKQHLIDNGGTISFSDIVAIFQEGTNINFTVDPVLETITINSTGGGGGGGGLAGKLYLFNNIGRTI